MKKYLLAIFLIPLFAPSCAAFKTGDINQLNEDMTRQQVDAILGAPTRTLAASFNQYGKIEVYEYKTYRSEIYSVEFLNNRLVGYEFMYQDLPPTTVGPVYPPTNPPRPVYPSRPPRPGENGGGSEPNRPGSGGNRPNTGSRPNTGGSEKPAPKPKDAARDSRSTDKDTRSADKRIEKN